MDSKPKHLVRAYIEAVQACTSAASSLTMGAMTPEQAQAAALLLAAATEGVRTIRQMGSDPLTEDDFVSIFGRKTDGS
jgi:hypothetical protein